MTDGHVNLETERAASQARREAIRRENALKVRAATCRRALVERPMDGRKKVPKTLEEAAEQLWPDLDEEARTEIVEAAHNLHREGRHLTPIETPQVLDIAKAYLRDHEQATSGEVWRHVIRQGQPVIQESSFKSAVMPQVRKELGIVYDRSHSRRPKASRKATTPDPTPEGVKAAMDIEPPDPLEDEEPEDEPSVEEGREVSERPEGDDSPPDAPAPSAGGDLEPVTVATTDPSAEPMKPSEDDAGNDGARTFQAGDRVLVQLGGDRFDAQRDDEAWHFELDARVESDETAANLFRLLSKVVAGPAS